MEKFKLTCIKTFDSYFSEGIEYECNIEPVYEVLDDFSRGEPSYIYAMKASHHYVEFFRGGEYCIYKYFNLKEAERIKKIKKVLEL